MQSILADAYFLSLSICFLDQGSGPPQQLRGGGLESLKVSLSQSHLVSWAYVKVFQHWCEYLVWNYVPAGLINK